MIRPLAPEVRSRLRSGIATPTVAQCVEELVLNSIDAGATCVAVRVDLANYKIQVVDNGCGLCKDEMKLVGERYTTSKCHDVKDLDNLSFFGYRGEALASISHISGVLEIVSKKRGSDVTYSKLFRNGKALNVFESSKQRPSPGTTITVHSVFQNLPVRRKMLSPSLDFERVRKRIQGLALVQPKVSITLRDDSTGAVAIQTHSTSSIANTFGSIFGQEYTKVLKKVEHSKDKFMVDGFIGTEGHFNKKMQFMYVNNRFVVKTKLHKLANILLGRSLIGKRKVATEGKDTPKGKDGNYSDLSSPGRSQELHGIFVLNITCSLSDYDITLDPGKTLVEFRNWIGILQCLEELITDFLNRENLTMKLDKPTDSASNLVVSEVDSSEGGDEESQEEDKGVEELSEEVDKKVSGLSEKYGHGIHTSNCTNNLQGLTVRRGAVQNRDTDGTEMETDESHVEETDVDDAKQQGSVPDGITQCEDKAGGTSDDVTNNNSSDSKVLNSGKFVGTYHEIHHDLETAKSSGNLDTTEGTSSAEEILVIPDSEESVHHAETPLAKCNRVRKLQDSATPLSAESNSSVTVSETEVKDKRRQHHLFAQSDCSAISISSGSDVDDRLLLLKQPHSTTMSKPAESANVGKTLDDPAVNIGKKRSQQFESTTELQVIPRKHHRENVRYPGSDSSECNDEVSDRRMPGQKVMTEKLESLEDEDDMYKTPVGRLPSIINKQISLTHTVSTLSSFRYRKSKEKVSLKTSSKSTVSDHETEDQDSAPYQYQSSLQLFRQSVKSSNTMKARKIQTSEYKAITDSSSKQHISGDHSIPQRENMKDSVHSASSTQVQCQKVQELVTQPQSHPVQQQYRSTFCDENRAESPKSKVQEPVITGMTQPQSHQAQQQYRSMHHDETRVESQTCSVLYELHHGIRSRPKETAQNERCAEASSSESNVNTGLRHQKPNLKRLRNQYNLNRNDTTETSQRKVEQEKACHPVGKRFMTSESFLVTARDVLGLPASPAASSATSCQVDVNAEKQKSKEGHNSKPVGVWSFIEDNCRKVNSTPSASTSAEASVPKVQDLSLRNRTRTEPYESVTISPKVYNNQDVNTLRSGEALEPGHQSHGVGDIGIHPRSEEVLIDHEASSTINPPSRIGAFDEVQREQQLNSHNGCDSSGSRQTSSKQFDQVDVLGTEKLSNRNLVAPDIVENAVKNVMSRSTHDLRHERTTERINSEVTRTYDSETDASSQVIQTQRFSPHPVDDMAESSVTSDGSRFDSIPAASCHEKDTEMDTKHSTDVSSVEGTQRFTPGSRDFLESDLSARDSESDIQEIIAPAELKTSANTQPERDIIPVGDTELYQNPHSASRDDLLKIISNCETENSNQATQESEMPNISQVQCQSDKGNSDNSKQNNAACTKPDNQVIEVIDDKVKERQNSASVESINQDWVAHYDPKKGTTLYVNIKSGNCTSEKPDNQDAVEQDGESRKDLKDGASTSSSVNAFMSSTGHVHPHLSHNATPFLPRTKKQRSCTTDTDPQSSENVCTEGTNEKVVSMVNKHLEKEGDDVASKWREDPKEQNDQDPDQNAADLQQLLSDWNNPTQGNLESSILDIRSNQASGTAIRIHGTLHPYRFTKAMFHNLQVLDQVDNKFIACMVNTYEDSSSAPNLLIMIDQHAAHERVRLEQLTADAYETNPDSSDEDSEESEDSLPTIKASSIIPPIQLTLSAEEIRLIKTFQGKLQRLGVGIDLPDSTDSKGMGCQEVAITHLPACMVEREAHELRRGRQSVALTMVESLVKEQLDLLQDTSGASAVLPKTITKLLNSQACHGAIKFGDKLSLDECVTLVGQLSQCNLPFQCAHGRPSLIPVLDIKMLQSKLQQTNDSDVDMPQLWKLKKKKLGKKLRCQEQQP